MNKYSFIALFAFTAAVFCSGEVLADEDGYELPRYRVLYKQDNFEIREYEPQLVAEIAVSGDRSGAANRGFRVLADYIFGENETDVSIAMTAPVVQLPTSPSRESGVTVTSLPAGNDRVDAEEDSEEQWLVRFKMPKQYTKDTLPVPKNDQIKVLTAPAVTTASVTFSGFWTDSNLKEHQELLTGFLKNQNLQAIQAPFYAFYNDPFTLPWNRRNEVIVPLKPESVAQFTNR